VVGERLMQHGMEEMNPRVRMRLRQPKELPLHFLDWVRFHRGQDAEHLVGHRGYRSGLIRTVAPAHAGLSIKGAVCHKGRNACSECGRRAVNACGVKPVMARKLPARGMTSFIAGPRHLRHAVISRRAMRLYKP
jgi:hypothetical protein